MRNSIKGKLILFFWILLSLLVFFSSLKEQVVLKSKLKSTIQVIFPEGWGFFTKSPRDSVLDIYKVNKDNLEKISVKNNSFENMYGFSRKARIIGYEGSIVTNLIPLSEWKIENISNLDSMSKSSSYILKTDLNYSYINNGTYLFILYEPIPYSWSKYNQAQIQKVKYTKVIINDL